MLYIDILTLFPSMFRGPFDDSLMARAQKKGLLTLGVHDLRDFGLTERKTVDDRPYGGGVGMIMMVEPIDNAIQALRKENSRVILMTPRGKPLTQAKARALSEESHLIIVCGRYEGFDERVHEQLVDEEISIGDYILMGGELPAMVLTEAVTRLVPGVIVKQEATELESFSDPSLLEGPQYTRPEEYKGHKVPEVLLSGNHKKIAEWREEYAKKKTQTNRPDLISEQVDQK